MNGNAQLLVSILLPEGNAASTLTGSVVVPGDRKYRVIGANFTPNAAAAANDTNNATITVSVDSVVIGARVTDVAGGALVAGAPVELTPPGNAIVEGGATRLQVAKAVAGTGVVVSGSAVLVLEEIR